MVQQIEQVLLFYVRPEVHFTLSPSSSLPALVAGGGGDAITSPSRAGLDSEDGVSSRSLELSARL